MLADVYPPENLGVVMGATMMANAIGFMLGPLVGSYFYDYHGYQAPFIFCAALAVLDFLCILFLAEPDKSKHVANAKAVAAASSSSSGAAEGDEQDQQINNLAVGNEEEELPSTSTLVAVERTAAAISDRKHAQEIIDDGIYHHDSRKKHASSSSSNYGSTASGSRTASASSSSSIMSAQEVDPSTDVSMFEIASNWTITCCLLATFVAASVFSGLEPIFPLYLQELLDASVSQTGIMLTAAIFPTLFASGIGYYADRIGHFYVSLLGMVVFTLATFSLAMPASFLAFVLPLMFFGLGSSMILTPLLPAMADVVNKKGWNCYAKTYALYNMTYSLSMAVGPILAGYVFDDFGFRWTMCMFGLMSAVATPVIFSAQIASVLSRWKGSRSVLSQSFMQN
ncbi:hypothetical protein BG004_002775 [Podila humilis]|nr:hypothetical protein BG004_002775 [Podila humilis]